MSSYSTIKKVGTLSKNDTLVKHLVLVALDFPRDSNNFSDKMSCIFYLLFHRDTLTLQPITLCSNTALYHASENVLPRINHIAFPVCYQYQTGL